MASVTAQPPPHGYTAVEWRRLQRIEDRRVAQEDLAAMVTELARVRTAPWPAVAAQLAAYRPADWRALSIRSGRYRRVPPEPAPTEVQAAVRALANPAARVPGRLSDGQLVAYLTDLLDEWPDARCTEEREVAVRLRGLVVDATRWHRTWGQLVSARSMADARHRPPLPEPEP